GFCNAATSGGQPSALRLTRGLRRSRNVSRAMALTVNPTLPVAAVSAVSQGGTATDLVLQPGTVVTAQVQNLLADNLVRIAIANLSLDVLTEVPLQAGQTLQLAVSQTADNIRLAVVGQGAATTADTVSLSPNAPVA